MITEHNLNPAQRIEKTIVVHHVFISSKTNFTPEQIKNMVDYYKSGYAFNEAGLVEKFIPSFDRSGIEIFNYMVEV